MAVTSIANQLILAVIDIKPKVNISFLALTHPAMLYGPCPIPRSRTVPGPLCTFLWCCWSKELALPFNKGSFRGLINASGTVCYTLSALWTHTHTHRHTQTYLGFIPSPVCNRLINTGNFHLLPTLVREKWSEAERKGSEREHARAVN